MRWKPLTRRVMLQLIGAALASAVLPWTALAQSNSETGNRVLYLTKSCGFEHSVVRRPEGQLAYSEKILIQLGKEHGFEVTVSKDGRVFDGDHEKYDAFVFYTTGDLTTVGKDQGPAMSPRGKQALLDAVASGKGFVGIHSASDTFHTPGDRFQNQENKDPYIAMLGGEFIRHGAQQKARMTVADPKFPGMEPAGKGFVMHEEWYSLKNFAPDLHVLLVNETEGMQGKDYQRPPFPATWARRHGQGRVFYTSMGHREDVWTNPVFQSILVGGIQWALGRVDAEIPPHIDQVTPKADEMPPK